MEKAIMQLRPPHEPFDLPHDMFPCPICGKSLSAQVMAWAQDAAGAWYATEVEIDCETEPDIEADEWDEWFANHYRMWGDCGLLDLIFTRAGISEKPPKGMAWCPPHARHKRVLDALEGSPLFEKRVVNMKPGYSGNPYCRVFTLKPAASGENQQ